MVDLFLRIGEHCMYKLCMLTEDKKAHAFYMLSSDADAINRSTLPPIFYDEMNVKLGLLVF